MQAIYKREMKSYFTGMIAYIFMGFMLLMIGIFSGSDNFRSGDPRFEGVLYGISLIFIVLIPLLTMRSFAQEKYDRTDQLLYSLPVKMSSIVMGKYLAMLTVYLIPMVFTMIYPLVLSMFGDVNFLQTYSSMLAYFLMGAALIAIGMFISSLTESQVISAVLSLLVMLMIYLMPLISTLVPADQLGSCLCFAVLIAAFAVVVYVMTKNAYAAVIVGLALEVALTVLYFVKPEIFASAFSDLLSHLSLFDRFLVFAQGMFDIGGIIYYLSIICIFVFLTVQSLEKKRYS